MKEKFKTFNFKPASRRLIATCNDIIESYQAQGLRLTARQLYYQLVTKNIIKNEEKAYKALTKLVSDGRLAGLIDWDAIEDRVRVPRRNNEYDNVADLVDAAIHSYRLPRWKGQDYYVELWVEKDALAGVLAPLASEFHVTLMVNRGYSSQSAMYEAAQRFMSRADGMDVKPALFYLGDHDPSGEDMVRDIDDRLRMFGVEGLEVQKIALTMSQIEQYEPPPNPAKMTDPRAAKYVEEHGNESWEVDALPPEVLAGLVRDAFKTVLNHRKYDAVKAQEEVDKKKLRAAAAKLSA